MSAIERTFTLINKVGLHARPASLLVQTAARFNSRIELATNGRIADAKRILQVLQLGAEQGAVVTARAEGEDAEQALAALGVLIADRFYDPE